MSGENEQVTADDVNDAGEQDTAQEANDDTSTDESDEDFDAPRALNKIRKLNAENKNLRDAKKAAEQKAAGSDEKDARIADLEAQNLRIRIGADLGLPSKLIDRLQGTTQEEVLADAEALLGLVDRKAPPTTPALDRLNPPDKQLTPTEPGMGTLRAGYAT